MVSVEEELSRTEFVFGSAGWEGLVAITAGDCVAFAQFIVVDNIHLTLFAFLVGQCARVVLDGEAQTLCAHSVSAADGVTAHHSSTNQIAAGVFVNNVSHISCRDFVER